MNRLPRHIGVCADDFGLNAAVNEASLELAAMGRLSALSCMSTAPAWRAGAGVLCSVGNGRLDAGLHLNLTEPFASTRWHRPLGALIAGACARLLPRALLRDEMASQFDAFENALGNPPDFVDGHQHVHQLPVVRDLLVTELLSRYPSRRPWLRNTAPPALREHRDADARKQRVIAALGARRLSAQARANGFAQNRELAGVYPFDGTVGDYADRLARWCDELGKGGLLMCHPASRAGQALRGDTDDPISGARLREYVVLRGERFAEMLQQREIRIAPLSRILASEPVHP